MGKKEEITDVISEKGIRELKVGTVLHFDYEGSPIWIKITKKSLKQMRIWGEHINLYDFNTGMSHYGHDVATDNRSIKQHGGIFCRDCEVTIDNYRTEDGEVKAMAREDLEEPDEPAKDATNES